MTAPIASQILKEFISGRPVERVGEDSETSSKPAPNGRLQEGAPETDQCNVQFLDDSRQVGSLRSAVSAPRLH